MPEAPVAPAMPAAPAAPSAPAAVSAPAPAAPSTAAPVAPAAPVPPAASAPVPPAAPAKYDSQTASTPPKQTDYPDTPEGIEQFAVDNGGYLLQHPEEANKPVAAAPVDPVAEAVKEAEGIQSDEAKPPAAEAVAPATPVAIEEWTAKSPELKAAFEKSPELRAAVMEMARINESAKPVLDIVGTVEEAQFAVEHANRLVSLQTNWMLSGDDPEMVGPAWEMTVDMFKERDANGKEIMENGKPKLAPDFKPFVFRAATAAMDEAMSPHSGQIAALTERLKGSYPNEEARAADEEALENADYAKKAYDFVKQDMQSRDEGPKLPALPPNATPEQIAYQKHLEDRQKELDAQSGKVSTDSRKSARAAVNKQAQQHHEVGINSFIETRINEMKERGEYLPDFVLTDKFINPSTGQPTKVSAFGAKLYLELNAKLFNNPVHKAKLASLEALGTPGLDARKAEIDRLRNLYLPKIFDKEVSRIQDSIRGTAKPKPPGTVDANGNNAGKPRLEPQSVGTVVPAGMSDDQIRTWAETEARKEPGFSGMSPADKETTILTRYSKKKYYGL